MFRSFFRCAVLPALAGMLVLMGAASAAAAAYPDKPITLIVPWAPGGTTDIIARAIAEQMTKSLGQSVIVENRSGAAGNIGSSIVAKARPDGYTLLVGSMSTHAMNPALIPNMPFRGVEDFTPIALVANVVNTMVINAAVPASNVRELIAYAKANPGKLAYASAGGGSTNHLAAEMFIMQPASACCMCLTKAAHRLCSTLWAIKPRCCSRRARRPCRMCARASCACSP